MRLRPSCENNSESRSRPFRNSIRPSSKRPRRRSKRFRPTVLGRKTMQGKADFTAAVPLFERAIQLDPNFAMAYAMLGTTYHNLGEKILAAKNTEKAYELRTRVSEWEKFYIESHYHDFVTGDLEKARTGL